jgi:hypothetical protein
MRRRILVSLIAVVGLCCGLVYGITRPQTYHAAGAVFLDVGPNAINPAAADVPPALQIVHLTIGAAPFRGHVLATATGPQVVRVQAAAPSAADAVALARVATSYVDSFPGAHVIDPPTIVFRSKRPALLSRGAFGLIAGLGVGILVSGRSRRPPTPASGPPRPPATGVREPRQPHPSSPGASEHVLVG